MSRTSDNSHWNSESAYHELREGHSGGQVESVLMPFLEEFGNKSGTNSITDFACGKGSIAAALGSQAAESRIDLSRILLVDVVEDNLHDAAALSYPDKVKVDTFQANGSNFSNFEGERTNLLYSWDAMVHFDIIDVVGYISTISSICSGYCFFHHSNLQNLTTDIQNNPHWRNFMGKDVFAQICISSGLDVVRQTEMDWGVPNIDCVTIARVVD